MAEYSVSADTTFRPIGRSLLITNIVLGQMCMYLSKFAMECNRTATAQCEKMKDLLTHEKKNFVKIAGMYAE